jgi:hypothetical protein
VPAEIYKEDGASAASAGTVAASLPDANGIALPASTGSDLPSRRRRGAWWLAGGLVIVLLAISLLVKRQQRLPFEHFTIQRVSASEQVRMTAISPDGIYIASVLSEPNGAESLWVHHLPTGSERHGEQDAAIAYEDVVFSPDGNNIYFRVKNATPSALPERYDVYRIPILGGRSVHILGNVDSQSALPGAASECASIARAIFRVPTSSSVPARRVATSGYWRKEGQSTRTLWRALQMAGLLRFQTTRAMSRRLTSLLD